MYTSLLDIFFGMINSRIRFNSLFFCFFVLISFEFAAEQMSSLSFGFCSVASGCYVLVADLVVRIVLDADSFFVFNYDNLLNWLCDA